MANQFRRKSIDVVFEEGDDVENDDGDEDDDETAIGWFSFGETDESERLSGTME